MEHFFDSPLLGALARALEADIAASQDTVMFPCRPFAAATAGNRTVLGRFKGPLSLRNSREFKNALRDLVRDNPQKVILDLAAASLSKSAVGTLVSFAADGQGRNNKIYLFRPSEQIRETLKELKLTSFFCFLETEEDIMASLLI